MTFSLAVRSHTLRRKTGDSGTCGGSFPPRKRRAARGLEGRLVALRCDSKGDGKVTGSEQRFGPTRYNSLGTEEPPTSVGSALSRLQQAALLQQDFLSY